MPFRNPFYGVYKSLKVGGQFIIAKSAKRSREMTTKAESYIQGTAKNRIMDIGGVKETISITAPILIGGGAGIDGRTLLNAQIANALNPASTTLPILASAEISISEQETQIQLSLKSDGNPSTIAFEVTGTPADNVRDGNNVAYLDPVNNMPTRVAKFYDFRVSLAGYHLFIKSASLSVEVQTTENYFIGGYAPGNSASLPSDAQPTPGGGATDGWNPAHNQYNMGTQFPWLGVSGISIGGRGTAAVLLDDQNGDYDFNQSGEATNVQDGSNSSPVNTYKPTDSELTLQLPGVTNYSSDDFKFQVYSASTNSGQFVDLFDTNIVQLKRSLITKADFKVETGLLTVDFDFKCWVQ